MKNIGKPYAVAPHVRFDEEGLVRSTMEWLLRHRQTKGAETDRRFLMVIGSQSFTLPKILIQHTAIRQADCHAMLATTNINTDTNLWSVIHNFGVSVSLRQNQNHPSVSSTYRATIKRSAPSRTTLRMMQEDGDGISSLASQNPSRRPHEPHPRPMSILTA